jgi:integrase
MAKIDRGRLLARPLRPSVTVDDGCPGLSLIVTTRRAFWALQYTARGHRPDGARWPAVRFELGDAHALTPQQARVEANAIKSLVAKGQDPYRQRRRDRDEEIARRALIPLTLSDALDAYKTALLDRREPKLSTRLQTLHYARKAMRLMQVETTPVGELGVAAVRKFVTTTKVSASEIRHLYGALNQFCAWMVEEKFTESNPCADVPRPRPSLPRDYVPAIEELRAVWTAVENTAMRDLVRFLLLVPLRRSEAGGLVWREVDLDRGWIKVDAERMKTGVAHELPLSAPALEILARRAAEPAADALVFPSAANLPFTGWTRFLRRLRRALGQANASRAHRFSPHDVRRSFASHLAERFDENLLDLMLAHKPASRQGSGAAYQKAKRLNERPRVMEEWARLVLGQEELGNVVTLPSRASA